MSDAENQTGLLLWIVALKSHPAKFCPRFMQVEVVVLGDDLAALSLPGVPDGFYCVLCL